jgi:hypothetical protein
MALSLEQCQRDLYFARASNIVIRDGSLYGGFNTLQESMSAS